MRSACRRLSSSLIYRIRISDTYMHVCFNTHTLVAAHAHSVHVYTYTLQCVQCSRVRDNTLCPAGLHARWNGYNNIDARVQQFNSVSATGPDSRLYCSRPCNIPYCSTYKCTILYCVAVDIIHDIVSQSLSSEVFGVRTNYVSFIYKWFSFSGYGAIVRRQGNIWE